MKVTYSDRIIFMTIFLEEETYEGEVFCYFLPKSAGISPQVLVSHFRIGMVTWWVRSQFSARTMI